MINLKLLVNCNYRCVINNVVKLNNLPNELPLHDVNRLKYLPKSSFTYNGRESCGAACMILGKYLIKNNYPIKMFLYKSAHTKYYNDHVFLMHNEYIIDPTYKQFFCQSSNHSMSNYNKYLYEEFFPFFVGTRDDLNKLFNNLNNVLYDDLNYKLDEDILDYWNNAKDITYKLDI